MSKRYNYFGIKSCCQAILIFNQILKSGYESYLAVITNREKPNRRTKMDLSWIETTLNASLMAVLSTIGIYLALIFLTRISGVRSFSKLSSFDFAITVAIGSLLASTILSKDPPLLLAMVALATLFGIQMLVASLRDNNFVSKLVNNKPLLLMKGDTMLIGNMKKGKISRPDLLAKLREANVLNIDQIHAVVMETTGDISVLHHDKDQVDFDTELLGDLKEQFEDIDAQNLGDGNKIRLKNSE